MKDVQEQFDGIQFVDGEYDDAHQQSQNRSGKGNVRNVLIDGSDRLFYVLWVLRVQYSNNTIRTNSKGLDKIR